MVRLKAYAILTVPEYTAFQFQNGTIKRRHGLIKYAYHILFQFQNGTIKSATVKAF